MAVISFVLFFQLVSSSFAVPSTGSTSSPQATSVQSYDELVKAIRGAKAESQARVEKIVEQERVREAWEIGKLIDAHVLQHKERADYGKRILLKLSKDLGMSDTELGYMLQFARAYPISRPAGKLSWSEYESLLAVNDAKKRQTLVDKAEKENWSRDRLRSEVRNVTQPGRSAPVEVLTAKPGILHAYRVVAGLEEGERVLDLGFSNYYKPVEKITFQPDDILEVVWGGEYKKLKDAGEDVLYTYKIEVLDIIDGDTIKAVIDLGFGFRTVQTLRLRGMDAPEIATADGKAAKEFLEKLLAPSSKVIIRTVKSDKYDRYLADVFLANEGGKEQYVNNQLLEEGHAVRVGE
ncbi:MAG: DUF1016 N-terminal domain-containing protein [Candidatus Omnitrophota bacterium]